MKKVDNSEMIIGVSELDFQRLMLEDNKDLPYIDHAYIRDEEGQLYLFAHGIGVLGLIVNGEVQEPGGHIHDYFFNEKGEELREPEDIKIVCCLSADMDWDGYETSFGTKVEPVIETHNAVSQWIHEREDGLYDIEVYEIEINRVRE